MGKLKGFVDKVRKVHGDMIDFARDNIKNDLEDFAPEKGEKKGEPQVEEA